MRTEKEKMLAGEKYLNISDELAEDRRTNRLLVDQFNRVAREDPKQGSQIIKKMFKHTGKKLISNLRFSVIMVIRFLLVRTFLPIMAVPSLMLVRLRLVTTLCWGQMFKSSQLIIRLMWMIARRGTSILRT